MKRYALAGASSRGLQMFAQPIAKRFQDTACLVGVFDPNSVRAAFVSQACGGVATYGDFDRMLADGRPDVVIVATVDRYHHEYIIRALEAGCDAITEKPMTIDDAKCREILAAEQRTGRKVTVTFNYRFNPYVTRVKELLRQGVIGEVLSVDFEWLLDTSHGADYFRRWHRRLENSGGLFVHKATHHFDTINWWIEAEPLQVFATGALRYYGPTRAERGERCHGCQYAGSCEYYVDMAKDPFISAFYFAAEREDGYQRDGCVFSPEINIYDTMSATVKYASGPMLSYSLVAHSPYEGWHAGINGSEGRLEAEELHSGQRVNEPTQHIKVYNRRGEIVTYDVPKPTGDHGGGDWRLQDRLFGGKELPDPLNFMAGSRAGALSILIGVAANQSVASGKAIAIADLLGE
jgi:predicted dehydrogenase